MRVKVILMLVLLGAFGILAAANISLTSESLPRLGEVSGFVKYGDYALFYGRYQDLSILDLSAGASPYSIATYNSTAAEGRCRELHVWGKKAYLVYKNEIEIVSLADIRQPVLQATFALGENCLVQIHNGTLYTLGSSGILSSYSLNNPLLPALLDTLDTGMHGSHWLLAGDDFMVCQKDSIYIVDIANPADLGLGGSIQYNDYPHHNSPVAVSGKYLYCNELSEINVYSLQNPYLPAKVGSLTLDCTDLWFQTHIYDNVLWSLYIDGSEEIEEIGLMAVDLSVPSAPAQLLKQPITEEIGNVLGMGEFMCASGNLLYLNHDPFYLKIFDISGGVLTELDTCYPLKSIHKIYANEQRIVGINQFIQLLDYNQDQSLYVQSQFEPETQGLDAVQIMDDLLLSSALTYPDNAPRLTIYDLQSSSISGSILMPCVYFEGPRRTQEIQRYDNYALVSNGGGGFYCIDLSDPTQPEQKFTINNGYSYTSATASAGELWLANYQDDWSGNYDSRISCYDISELNNPVLKYNLEGGFMARKLLKIGDYLYALSWNQLECYHLGNDSVIEQSEYSMAAGDGADMLALGKGLLIGTKEGMKVFSLKDPLHPVIVGDYPFEMENPDTYPWDYPYYPDVSFAVSNSKILVANGWSLKCFDASLAAFLCEDSPYINSAKLIAFPNPAREKISFCFNKGAEGTAVLELYNIRGQKLIVKSFTSAADGLVLDKLDLRDATGKRLAAGVYILRVKHGSSQQVCKIAVLP